MNLSTESIARAIAKHSWWTLLAWLLILAGAFALTSTLMKDALEGQGSSRRGPQ